MNQDEVRSQILTILHRAAPEVDLKNIDSGQSLRESLDIDSFDFLNVIIGIHEKFSVEIPESEYQNVSTLDSMVQYVSRRLNA
jgi:acyl carrier protein